MGCQWLVVVELPVEGCQWSMAVDRQWLVASGGEDSLENGPNYKTKANNITKTKPTTKQSQQRKQKIIFNTFNTPQSGFL